MRHLLFILSLFSMLGLSAQQKLEFTVLAGEFSRINCPVSLDLSSSNLELNNTGLQLYQMEGKTEISVPSQLEEGKNPRLWFILKGELKKGGKREYVLRVTTAQPDKDGIGIERISRD